MRRVLSFTLIIPLVASACGSGPEQQPPDPDAGDGIGDAGSDAFSPYLVIDCPGRQFTFSARLEAVAPAQFRLQFGQTGSFEYEECHRADPADLNGVWETATGSVDLVARGETVIEYVVCTGLAGTFRYLETHSEPPGPCLDPEGDGYGLGQWFALVEGGVVVDHDSLGTWVNLDDEPSAQCTGFEDYDPAFDCYVTDNL